MGDKLTVPLAAGHLKRQLRLSTKYGPRSAPKQALHSLVKARLALRRAYGTAVSDFPPSTYLTSTY